MWTPIEEAINEIRDGKMLIVVDDEDRENEGDLVMAADKVTPEKVNFMMREGRGLICVPLHRAHTERMNLTPMDGEAPDMSRCNFTISVDAKKNTTTGISASDRATTIAALANKKSVAADFMRPGHIFPLMARDGGVLVRAGHTEAAVDLARLAGLSESAVICEIIKDDGEMARRDDLVKFAKKHGLKMITIKDLIAYQRLKESLVKREVETLLETEYGKFTIIVYSNSIDSFEHLALVCGKVDGKENVLVRAHSECMTGDVFHSLHCDCGNQLNAAMKIIAEKGEGVILYMRQEGRGLGLINKLKAYNLQQQKGYDTVEANKKLGFKADLRDYGIGAQILKDLGLNTIQLLTNNPAKIIGLEGHGLKVTKQIPLECETGNLAKRYMKTKKDKLGHLLKLV